MLAFDISEYDISTDAEEPQQVISFVPDRRRSSKAFNAIDSAEREVASFTLGKGKADWGPLTIYAVMKSGDVYAVCPYMPKNAYVACRLTYGPSHSRI
jgi:nucleoporin NUP82